MSVEVGYLFGRQVEKVGQEVIGLVEQGDLALADDALLLYEQRIVLPCVAMLDFYGDTGLHVQFLVALDAALALPVVGLAPGTLENGLEMLYGVESMA